MSQFAISVLLAAAFVPASAADGAAPECCVQIGTRVPTILLASVDEVIE